MPSQLLTSIIDGLLLGSVYGVAAMGLTLIWGVMNVINLAHGPIMALGMFGVYLLFATLGMNPYLGLGLTAVFGFVLGVVIYYVAVQRIINAPHLSSLLSTYAVSMIIIGLGTAFFTTSPRNVDFSLVTFTLGALSIPGTRIMGAVSAFLVAGARSLLVSLWPVADESTSRLMRSFYRHRQTMGAAQALRTAQVEALGRREDGAPLFWAPFVLVGDWR